MRLRTNRRRGVILLVVLIMLTLFAIAGLTFVLYAEAAAESARFNKDSESFAVSNAPDMDPTQSLDLFLGQLIYGTKSDLNGSLSSLRGHSLAETMYGSYDSLGTVPSDLPYNGTGRLHNGQTALAGSPDEYNLINYMYFKSDGFVHDPSRYGSRTDPTQPYPATDPYTGGQNAPYTFPDANSMFLATINQATGNVITPSYYRSAIFDPTNQGQASPNWTNAQGKYMTLRPRPVDNPGLTPPMQANGQPDPNNLDVKNLSGSSGGNDSIWIDIGAPELYTASGLRYKMMVAPLILDLDNRINLNVVGNILGSYGSSGNIHASNQGWGAWEVNMGKVLDAPNNEWKNVFLGNGGLPGRYGPGQKPLSVFGFNGLAPHIYAPVDFNGLNDPIAGSASLTQAYSLPGQPGAQFFALFPSVGYGYGAPMETTDTGLGTGTPLHPAFYNPFSSSNVASANRTLPLTSHATLMYAGAAASPNSELLKLCPVNFNDPANGVRRIAETTLLSMDLDRLGVAPFVWDQSNPGYNIVFNAAAGQPNGGYTSDGAAPTFFNPPTVANRAGTPANSDFDPATWRFTNAANLPRLDLSRSLTPYTGPLGNPAQAAADRQLFAMDIFKRLLTVTGMTVAYNGGNLSGAQPAPYATLRWLAQLSANMVDYIDTDDVMTAFQWAQQPLLPDTGYVFGTELPKLAVNEVYLEYDNDQNDPVPNPPPPTLKIAKSSYHMNVWTELVNPLPSTTDPNAPPNGINVNNDAKLVDSNGNPLYQLVLTKQNQGIRNAGNLAGDPDGTGGANPPFAPQLAPPQGYALNNDFDANPPQQVLAVFNQWAAGGNNVQAVTPLGTNTNSAPGAGSNAGFLIVGPPNPPLFKGQNANTQVQIQSSVTANGTNGTNSMSYTVEQTDVNANPTPAGTPVNNSLAPTILLQRLANPYQPFNATTNPYITVDYADMTAVGTSLGQPVINDARGYDANGPIANAPSNPNKRVSFGRKQPYAGQAGQLNQPTTLQWQQQTAPGALGQNDPNTTFFNVNTATNPATTPDWLVHLDRTLISPIELLNVSGFKPHELTQQFIDVNGKKGDGLGNGHVAPWQDQNMRLYRLLEFFRVPNITPGVVPNGRVPGKININTLDSNAVEVFRALCDAEPGNSFYYNNSTPPLNPVLDANVNTLFNTLMTARQTNGPFVGMAQGAYPVADAQFPNPPNGPYSSGAGLVNTLLGSGLQNGAAGAADRYQQLELLNKIYNNTTTRSNCFAVWLTVGFFQITDDQTQPMKLGPEINAAQGKNIRHHMFAIIDRTQLTTFTTKVGNGGVAAGNGVNINVPTAVNDPRTNVTWNIQAGTTLVYDPGSANEETVVVLPSGNTANFVNGHGAGATVISRGNPGPWSLPGTLPYDVTQDGQVVPYWVIID